MAVGKDIETRGHILGFREEISKTANESSGEEFFTWFDDAVSKDAAFVRGSWDFSYHIAFPALSLLSSPEEKVALEIGYGGGRILAGAARHFEKIIGIDVHCNQEKVKSELKSRGVDNIELYSVNGNEIPLENESIDFVYSFVVFQHVEKIEIFKDYVNEIRRVLKPGGVAVLYFGRRSTLSYGRASKMLYAVDVLLERIFLPKGYREIPARVNCTNLVISLAHAKKIVREAGFRVCSSMPSRRKVPDDYILFGGQHGMVLTR